MGTTWFAWLSIQEPWKPFKTCTVRSMDIVSHIFTMYLKYQPVLLNMYVSILHLIWLMFPYSASALGHIVCWNIMENKTSEGESNVYFEFSAILTHTVWAGCCYPLNMYALNDLIMHGLMWDRWFTFKVDRSKVKVNKSMVRRTHFPGCLRI